MNNSIISKKYFNWICSIVCDKKYSGSKNYNKLLKYLYNKTFTYIIPLDKNRADDGLYLRYRFEDEDISRHFSEECSILEMMVALSIRCEDQIMFDDQLGDQTAKWFWMMINNLGLSNMTDDRFDKIFVDGVIFNFLNRKYDANGRGGLFVVNDSNKDLRSIEIWYQMCLYLNTIDI